MKKIRPDPNDLVLRRMAVPRAKKADFTLCICTGDYENEIQVLEAVSRQRLDTLLGETKAQEAKMGTCLGVQCAGSKKDTND